ncbi:MAG TPA: acyltransferase [Pirellulales bacterium]|jgi:acetyltransferase-like isoleucine patch superfamily enzyme|nr:acyltransferase [Pirellulales bacterium]
MGSFTHRLALCESAQIGEGTRIWAFAHIMAGAAVGSDCNIGDGAFIESGAKLGDRVTVKNQALIWDGVTIADDVFIGPGVIFTNDRTPRSPRMPAVASRYANPSGWRVATRVGRGASLGAGAIIVCGVTIGEFAMVGAGTVVTRDVPPHRMVVGNPARVVGWACACGVRLDSARHCPQCGRQYEVRSEKYEETLVECGKRLSA